MNQQSQGSSQEVYKVILVGDQGVGKSSILLRYTQQIFQREYTVTIGLEFASKKIQIQDNLLTLQIWDTAGQEAFRSIVRSFYRHSAAIIIVYKISSRESFESVVGWAREIVENSDPGVVITLVGNMCDLEQERQVSLEEGKQKAQEINALFFETSAANNTCIDDIFINTLEKASQTNKLRSDSNQNVRDSILLKNQVYQADASQSKVSQSSNSQQNQQEKKSCC